MKKQIISGMVLLLATTFVLGQNTVEWLYEFQPIKSIRGGRIIYSDQTGYYLKVGMADFDPLEEGIPHHGYSLVSGLMKLKLDYSVDSIYPFNYNVSSKRTLKGPSGVVFGLSTQKGMITEPQPMGSNGFQLTSYSECAKLTCATFNVTTLEYNYDVEQECNFQDYLCYFFKNDEYYIERFPVILPVGFSNC